MEENTYELSGKKYRKIERNEKIEKGAMHSFQTKQLNPIMYEDTIGKTPSEFSIKREFYNPIIERTVKIIPDIGPESPREWDNLGTMACSHSRYTLGDKDGYDLLKEAVCSHKNYREWWHDLEYNDEAYDEDEESHWIQIAEDKLDMIVLPLYLYDHSGITMNTTGFSCGWDSDQVGAIFVTREDVRKEFKVKRISKKLLERVRKQLVAEVEVFDQFLTGDVWGFQLFEDGEETDSCWGFYGSDPKENGMIDHWPKEFHDIEPEEASY